MSDTMRYLVLAAAVLLAHVLTYHGSLQAEQVQQCLYQYIEEPPSELNCNPYESNQLRLQCQFLVNSTELLALTVWWFFTAASADTPTRVAMATRITRFRRLNTSLVGVTSQINITNPMEGGYFCQPFLADGTPLLPSMQTTVFAPDVYIVLSLPPCGAEFLSVPVVRCAQQEAPDRTVVTMTMVDMTTIVTPQIPTPTSTLHRVTVRATPTPEIEATPTAEVEGPGTVDPSDTSSDILLFPPWVFAVAGGVAVVLLALVVACGIMLCWKSRRKTKKPNFSSTRTGSCRPHTAVSTTRSTATLITTAFEALPPAFEVPPPPYTPPAWPPTRRQESVRQDLEDPRISTPSYCNSTGDYFLVEGDDTLESSVLGTYGYVQPPKHSNAHAGRHKGLLPPPTDNPQLQSQADSRHTRGPPTVVQDGKEYHIVDPSRMEKNGNHYTIPSHSRSRVGERGMGHSAAGKGVAVRQYQGLKIETMDYMSLYMGGNPSQLPRQTNHTLAAGRKHHKNTAMI